MAVSAEQWDVLAAAAALTGVSVAEYVDRAVAARVRQDLMDLVGAPSDASVPGGLDCARDPRRPGEPVTALVMAFGWQNAAADPAIDASGLAQREVAGADTAVPRGRELLRDTWLGWDAAALAGEGMVMVSELVTNAVVHGGGNVSLLLAGSMAGSVKGGEVVCGVGDASAVSPRTRWACPVDESGRGLALVAALASRCGWYRAGAGKVVWFSQRLTSTDGCGGNGRGGDDFPVHAGPPHPLLDGAARWRWAARHPRARKR